MIEDAIVIGEYERAFYDSQYASMAPLFDHYGVALWTPEAGGPVGNWTIQPVSAPLQRRFSSVLNCGHKDGDRPEPEMARFYGCLRRFTGVTASQQVLG